MPFYRLKYHLVWACKYREARLTPEVEEVLFPYLVGKARGLGSQILAVNGCEDHVHMVLSVPPTLSISYVVKCLKGASSHDLKIRWQDGYGAFTVGEKGLPVAVAYVQNQKQHHAQKTLFQALERWEEEEEKLGLREELGEYRVGDDAPF